MTMTILAITMITLAMIIRAMIMVMEIRRTSGLTFEPFFRFDMPQTIA